MTDADIVTAIINAIQTDTNLLILMRAAVTNNIANVPSIQLHMLASLLGIDTSSGS